MLNTHTTSAAAVKMYPWYRDSMSQLGQFCANVKTENGYGDCMLAIDYAQNKVRPYVRAAIAQHVLLALILHDRRSFAAKNIFTPL